MTGKEKESKERRYHHRALTSDDVKKFLNSDFILIAMKNTPIIG